MKISIACSQLGRDVDDQVCKLPKCCLSQGLVLGGGCRSLFNKQQKPTILSQVSEVGVGLIPVAGTKELARAYDHAKLGRTDPMSFLQRAFMLIGMAQTSTSGREAVEMGLYGPKAEVIIWGSSNLKQKIWLWKCISEAM